MSENTYPKSVADVINTLTEICRHQERHDLVELLENAHAYFDAINFDNWNGGTTTWALRLEVPIFQFANVQLRRSEVERELEVRLDFLDRLYPNDPLGEVTITPQTSARIALGQQLVPSETDVRRLWHEGFVRLFLSHVSRHKVEVARIKAVLFENGISAFVAHEDIEPSLEWQNEISLALRSMDALVALVTGDFHGSSWTDQEVGWALGRGLPVFPVRLGADPYGFVGKIQAIRGAFDNPVALADSITRALLLNNLVHAKMRRALVNAFANSQSDATAKRLGKMIVGVQDFTPDELDRLKGACSNNNHIADSSDVCKQIYDTFGSPKFVLDILDDVPF